METPQRVPTGTMPESPTSPGRADRLLLRRALRDLARGALFAHRPVLVAACDRAAKALPKDLKPAQADVDLLASALHALQADAHSHGVADLPTFLKGNALVPEGVDPEGLAVLLRTEDAATALRERLAGATLSELAARSLFDPDDEDGDNASEASESHINRLRGVTRSVSAFLSLAADVSKKAYPKAKVAATAIDKWTAVLSYTVPLLVALFVVFEFLPRSIQPQALVLLLSVAFLRRSTWLLSGKHSGLAELALVILLGAWFLYVTSPSESDPPTLATLKSTARWPAERSAALAYRISASVADTLGIDDLVELGDRAADAAYDAARRAVQATVPQLERIGEVLSNVQEALSQFNTTAIGEMAEDAGEAMMDMAKSAGSAVADAVSDVVPDAVEEMAKEAFNDAAEFVDDVGDAIAEGVQDIGEVAGGWIKGIGRMFGRGS